MQYSRRLEYLPLIEDVLKQKTDIKDASIKR